MSETTRAISTALLAELEQPSGGSAVEQTPFLYTGGLDDRTTDWTLNSVRYYSAKEGRWTQQDVIDAPLDPMNGNRYAYAANDPINFVDPTGEVSSCGAVAVGLGAVALLSGGVGLVAAAGTTAAAATVAGAAGALSFSTGVPAFALTLLVVFGGGC
ncbi:RHS repeat-associated core domain-containing protein [Cellulomonas septica]|uniref:RHS repeat-associated core domain-containing protein n=1 Tax=Cellulomonas septica TaxID=285080 RepID=A0ABX1JWL6_9CELL|nr:RHS repeat-associated core domain-containing protein [Cellulomonas septica]NKY38695.1 RHS repeat-associated core domain-containing protein [Cellulomonas septica]